MAARFDFRLICRIATFAAVLAFASLQFLSVAHAEDHHDDHAPASSCFVCSFAKYDDGDDGVAPRPLLLVRNFDNDAVKAPATQERKIACAVYASVRAPPLF